MIYVYWKRVVERAEDITLKDSLLTPEEFPYAKKFRTLQSANQNSSPDKSGGRRTVICFGAE